MYPILAAAALVVAFAALGRGKRKRTIVWDLQVSQNEDDVWMDEYNGSMSLYGGLLGESPNKVRSNIDIGAREWTGLRFQFPAPIPAGKRITSAYISIFTLTYDDANMDILIEDSTNPLPFSTNNYNLSSRPSRAITIPWVQDNCGLNTWVNSPQLAALIQDITGYSPSAVVFILKPRSDMDRMFYTCDSSLAPQLAAKLHLEYS